MTRKKLSAIEIALGARATYGARSAAHRPRPRAMAKPVDGRDQVFRECDERIRAWGAADTVCQCGTFICSRRGPCAPAAPLPAPESPRAKAEAPRFKVGDRVRQTCECCAGREAWVAKASVDVCALSRESATGAIDCWASVAELEPLSAPTHEPSAEPEGDAALLERCGWKRASNEFYAPAFVYGGLEWSATFPRCGWRKFDNALTGFKAKFGYSDRPPPPTLLQAACAALAITLHVEERGWVRAYDGSPRTSETWLCDADDIESAARAALAAWHQKHGGGR